MRAFPKKTALLLGVLLALTMAVWLAYLKDSSLPWNDTSPGSEDTQVAQERAALQAREDAADQTVWAKEVLAQSCGRTLETLWDSLNASNRSLSLIARFPVQEIVVPEWGEPVRLSHGIELRKPRADGRKLSQAEWRQLVERISREGWLLNTIEFRHNRFDTDQDGKPSRSVFFFSAHLNRTANSQRAVIEGDIVVEWAEKQPHEKLHPVKSIDASRVEAKERTGPALFQLVLEETITPPGRSSYMDPLILYDLDGDGGPEIVLAAANLVYHRQEQGNYATAPLCRSPVQRLTAAVIADFDHDGAADLLCANSQGLNLFQGSTQGKFDELPRHVWMASPPLQNAMVLTCGDVDQDGDLDVFIGQYKVPTLGQVLRPHYYDANDGWPSYLLLNDSRGNFTDATESAGLGEKRERRTYSASLADLNGDMHADLVVVSDFAGLDLYRNDGHGRFTDVTHEWVSEPRAFGMAHALADFNRDGRIDLLMIGMPSPTVDRLQHLGLWRPYSAEDSVMRPAMAYGNRLYLTRPDAKFEQTELNESIARSGWSWGCSAFDFDNDSLLDLYIANGLESRQSVQDYEPEFWLHDIFVDDKVDDVVATAYFMNKFARTRAAGWSYGGYEKNRLYLRQRDESFLEIAHLVGVALEQDSRNVVTADLDSDGRMDLLLTTLEVWPHPRQALHAYVNRLEGSGHWIGFRFREQADAASPVGTQVTIRCGKQTATRQIVTGDSHRSQHGNTVHFGLGPAERVDSVEIRWPDGQTNRLSGLTVDRYYDIRGPRHR